MNISKVMFELSSGTKQRQKKGHSQAQNNLAVMYALGRVEDAAPIDALSWLLKAAEQGDVKAESNLNCLQISQDALGKQSFVI